MSVTVDDVAFLANDGTSLAGTLTSAGPAPRPAVVILNGSGPLDRNSAMPGQALGFADAMAEALAAAGIASIRFDKRGVGSSGGDYLSTSLDQEAGDARAAMDWLRALPGVDQNRVGLVGHSVGALISVRLAAADPSVAAIGLLAGPAQQGRQVMAWQAQRIAESLPGPRWFLPKMALAAHGYGQRKLERSTGPTARVPLKRQPAAWMRQFMAYDPEADLRLLRCPVLAITGQKDLQVDFGDVERTGSLVAGPFTGETPAHLTHLLRVEEGGGEVLSYRSQLKRPVDPDLLDRVSRWLARQLAGSDATPTDTAPTD